MGLTKKYWKTCLNWSLWTIIFTTSQFLCIVETILESGEEDWDYSFNLNVKKYVSHDTETAPDLPETPFLERME